jgi:hypothetical protein
MFAIPVVAERANRRITSTPWQMKSPKDETTFRKKRHFFDCG